MTKRNNAIDRLYKIVKIMVDDYLEVISLFVL